jgi:hypothetical protein
VGGRAWRPCSFPLRSRVRLVRGEAGRRSSGRVTRALSGVLGAQIDPGLTVIKGVSGELIQVKGPPR